MANVTATDQIIGDGPANLQNYGGMPTVLRTFETQEHEVTNAPDSNDSWNTNMGNPVGPK